MAITLLLHKFKCTIVFCIPGWLSNTQYTRENLSNLFASCRAGPKPRQLRPRPKASTTKNIYPLKKAHLIVKCHNFIKNINFFKRKLIDVSL